MKRRIHIPRWSILLIDIGICLFSILLAYQLRFNFRLMPDEIVRMQFGIPVLLFIRLCCFLFFRTGASLIIYTSIEDAFRIFVTLAIGTLVTGLSNFIAVTFSDHYFIPFSILLIDFFVTVFLIGGFRLGVRMIYERAGKQDSDSRRVLIFGAGQTGITTKRTLLRDPSARYDVVAFLDDNKSLHNKKLEGVIILPSSELEEIFLEKKIDLFILSPVTISPQRLQTLVDLCLKHDVRVLHVPPMSKWINGELSFRQIREIKIEELLERNPIQLDLDIISKQISGKRILVTGGAGSIGSEIVRQLARFNPGKLIVLDQSESPLFEIEMELKQFRPRLEFEVVIADVRNATRMAEVFEKFKPQLVYHAAAYKHVPMMEMNPTEAVLANVAGTMICADLAVKSGSENFVLISTDKAVNPTSVMGASKRVSEIYVQSLNQFLEQKNEPHTKFITTRFGNVLGSSGSVIPIFRKQIEAGGPVTVTHPEVTRFFMTIPEACQLVLEAGALGNGGEIYIFDMGESVRIADLARKMIKLSGFEEGKEIRIEFSGLRPGEKLFEELLNTKENTLATHHPKIMIAKVRESDYFTAQKQIGDLLSLAESGQENNLVSAMKTMVPEYISNNSAFELLDVAKVSKG